MQIAPLPLDEAERLQVLRSLGLMDTAPEPAFDLIAQLAQSLVESETAVVSLIDADRQWFKARVGLNISETPRDTAFCTHAILSEKVLCIEDARADARFSANPFVTGEPGIASYIGAPITVFGRKLGTVCAFGPEPRSFSDKERGQFRALAALAAERMETRRRSLFVSDLFASTSDAVLAVDAYERIIHWDGASERLFGRTHADAIGQPLSIIMPEKHRAAHSAAFSRLRSSGTAKLAGQPLEVSALRKDGSEFPVELTFSIWQEAKQLTVGAIVRDISQRRALEDARLANEAKGRFLANISHEIRTPLNGVLGMAQILAETALSPKQTELVEVIRTSAEGLNRLLADVLESARLETGHVVVEAEPFDLAELIARSCAPHRTIAVKKGLSFGCVVPRGPIWVEGSPVRIEQILGNLLANAVKFTKTGKVSLDVSRQGEQWTFLIRDTGIGFGQDAQARIFQPFEQGDDSVTRTFGGSGLGLSISRSLAVAMGGDLSGVAKLGEGAEFRLTLPLKASHRDMAIRAA